MEKFSNLSHPVQCIITEPSECGKSYFLTKLLLNIFIEYEKIYIFSPSLHQDLDQKLIKSFSNYIPIHKILNLLNEGDIDIATEELFNNKVFKKSNTEIEPYGSIEELKYPREYEDGGIIILQDFNEEEMNDPRVQAMFKRSRQNNLSILKSAKFKMNYQKAQLEPMVKSITSLNQTFSWMFTISIKTKQAWT